MIASIKLPAVISSPVVRGCPIALETRTPVHQLLKDISIQRENLPLGPLPIAVDQNACHRIRIAPHIRIVLHHAALLAASHLTIVFVLLGLLLGLGLRLLMLALTFPLDRHPFTFARQLYVTLHFGVNAALTVTVLLLLPFDAITLLMNAFTVAVTLTFAFTVLFLALTLDLLFTIGGGHLLVVLHRSGGGRLLLVHVLLGLGLLLGLRLLLLLLLLLGTGRRLTVVLLAALHVHLEVLQKKTKSIILKKERRRQRLTHHLLLPLLLDLHRNLLFARRQMVPNVVMVRRRWLTTALRRWFRDGHRHGRLAALRLIVVLVGHGQQRLLDGNVDKRRERFVAGR
jgi:hypothetical protein